MSANVSIAVSSTIDSPTILQKAVDLATKIGLPLASQGQKPAWLLAYTGDGLHLLQVCSGGRPPTSRLFIDFVAGKNGFRLAHDCTIQQPLARALGIKRGHRPTVLDGTAGLGGDAWVLASLGCQVTMCERSQVLHALLEDGLHRASTSSGRAVAVCGRLRLVHADTLLYLQSRPESYQVVYLDPMYPMRNSSALNSLAMRTIRELVGNDDDSDAVLTAALAAASERVVVKRPKGAPPVGGVTPSHSSATRKNRFDVYLTGTGRNL